MSHVTGFEDTTRGRLVMRSSPCSTPGEHVTSDGSKNKQRPPIGAASISPNGHFSFGPENGNLAPLAPLVPKSTAPISFVCPPAPDVEFSNVSILWAGAGG